MNFKTTERLKACYQAPATEEFKLASEAPFLTLSNPPASEPEGWDIDDTFNW